DHTSCERLLHFVDECDRNGTAHVEVIGLERMLRRSEFPSCMRIRGARPIETKDGDHGKTAARVREGVMLSEVGVAAAVAADGTTDDGIAWISLSDPATTAEGDFEAAMDRETLAEADMDWLDLSKAS